MIKRWMIKIQIYIANFNLGVRKISGRHTRTLSGLTLPLSIVAAGHPLGDLATSSSGNVGDHHGQDARNAVSSGPSSNENNTCIISFVLTLPFMSLSATTSFWASGSPTAPSAASVVFAVLPCRSYFTQYFTPNTLQHTTPLNHTPIDLIRVSKSWEDQKAQRTRRPSSGSRRSFIDGPLLRNGHH